MLDVVGLEQYKNGVGACYLRLKSIGILYFEEAEPRRLRSPILRFLTCGQSSLLGTVKISLLV